MKSDPAERFDVGGLPGRPAAADGGGFGEYPSRTQSRTIGAARVQGGPTRQAPACSSSFPARSDSRMHRAGERPPGPELARWATTAPAWSGPVSRSKNRCNASRDVQRVAPIWTVSSRTPRHPVVVQR